MSWLHCMWGLGASVGPYIMGYALTGGHGWNMGYAYISILQIIPTVIILFSLPLWKNRAESSDTNNDVTAKALSIPEILAIPGAKAVLLMPAVFGLIANHISASLYPVYLLAIVILMILMHEKLVRTC